MLGDLSEVPPMAHSGHFPNPGPSCQAGYGPGAVESLGGQLSESPIIPGLREQDAQAAPVFSGSRARVCRKLPDLDGSLGNVRENSISYM